MVRRRPGRSPAQGALQLLMGDAGQGAGDGGVGRVVPREARSSFSTVQRNLAKRGMRAMLVWPQTKPGRVSRGMGWKG